MYDDGFKKNWQKNYDIVNVCVFPNFPFLFSFYKKRDNVFMMTSENENAI